MKRTTGILLVIFTFTVIIGLSRCKNNNSDISASGTQSTYDNDRLEMKVSIKAVDQFSIVETVLNAIRQTQFWDSRIINKGPYAAMVSFEDDRSKELERWVIKSKMIVENGTDTNKVLCWIADPTELIKAVFRVTSAPTDSNPYGEWSMNVGFFDVSSGTQTGFFVAQSSVDSDGNVNVYLNSEMEQDDGMGGSFTYTQKGILVINNDTGKGIITYTDWGMGGPTLKTASYAYNANQVIVDEDGDGTGDSLFNRNSYSDIHMDYNIYDSSGSNIRYSKSFGMPLKYTGGSSTEYYYYGGWQGRHQLWGPQGASALTEGTTLASGEYGDTSTYTIGKIYNGYLIEKTLIDTALNDIKGEIIETWMNEGFRLKWVNGNSSWEKCNGSGNPWDCTTTDNTLYDVSGLASDSDGHKWVYVWGDQASQELTPATSTTFTGYTPADGDTVWVNISQPVFISYDGVSWVQFTNVTFDGWDPQVDTGTTQAYSFSSNGSFYMHSKGVNYILVVTDSGATQSLKKEEENVIQPGTEAAALNGVVFVADTQTYTFSYNAGTDEIVLNDSNGNPYTDSIWYMEKQSGGVANVSYSWQYAKGADETWNIMTYLKDADSNWVFLDDPIFFASTTGQDVSGNNVTVNGLAYDGHLFGIPDVWRMLEENNWVLSTDLKNKIINIPDGDITGKDSTVYKIKAVFGVRLLETATPDGSSPTIDPTLTLTGLPTYDSSEDIGTMPVVDTITIIEGEFVTD